MSYFNEKCTIFYFGSDCAPDPTGRTYSASPEPLAGFKGATSKGNGRGRDERKW